MSAAPIERIDEDLLEALDWQPPCDISEKHTAETAPAAVAVFGKIPQPCGCVAPRPLVLMCRTCWTGYLESRIQCPKCGPWVPFPETFRRVVWL